MKKIIYVTAAATAIEYIVNSFVAPTFFNIPPHNIIFTVVLIGNIATAIAVHYIYKKS